MQQEWAQQTGERPPVRGEGVSGNAWEDYREALNLIRGLKRIKVPSNDEPIPPHPAEVVGLADGIRAGARRTCPPWARMDRSRHHVQDHPDRVIQRKGTETRSEVSAADISAWQENVMRFDVPSRISL